MIIAYVRGVAWTGGVTQLVHIVMSANKTGSPRVTTAPIKPQWMLASILAIDYHHHHLGKRIQPDHARDKIRKQ